MDTKKRIWVEKNSNGNPVNVYWISPILPHQEPPHTDKHGDYTTVQRLYTIHRRGAGADPGGDWGDRPPKTYESNFFHHDFLQSWKTLDCQLRLDCQILLKSPPSLNVQAGSAPDLESWHRRLKRYFWSNKWMIMQCATFSKSLTPRNIDKSVSDTRIRFPFESSFWISVFGRKLTILPDIQPVNRIVIITGW